MYVAVSDDEERIRVLDKDSIIGRINVPILDDIGVGGDPAPRHDAIRGGEVRIAIDVDCRMGRIRKGMDLL
jgi:hypothetical protein